MRNIVPEPDREGAKLDGKEYSKLNSSKLNSAIRANSLISGLIALSLLVALLSLCIPGSAASLYDNSSSNTSMDGTVTLYLKSSFYAAGDVVNISIMNKDRLSPGAQLSLDIFLQEDPTYAFKYLGLVEDNVLFVPNKVGDYIIRIYSIDGNNISMIAQRSFLVYDRQESGCDQYPLGSAVVINFKDYPEYSINSTNANIGAANLPSSVSMIYTDDTTGVTQKYVYSQEIQDMITYQASKTGKYSVYADDNYLDCFIIKEFKENISAGNVSYNLTGTGIQVGNQSGNQSGNSSYDILNNVSIDNLLKGYYVGNSTPQNTSDIQGGFSISGSSTNGTLNASGNIAAIGTDYSSPMPSIISYDSNNLSLNFSSDIIVDMKGLSSGYVAARIMLGGQEGAGELWIFDVNNSRILRLAYGNDAPAGDFAIGAKDDVIFWISKDHKTVYAYVLSTGKIVTRILNPYDPSQGELGIVDFSSNGDLDIKWQVQLDSTQFYFYNIAYGQVFSDDDLGVKETFRQQKSLDHLMNGEDIAHLDLEIDRNFVAENQT